MTSTPDEPLRDEDMESVGSAGTPMGDGDGTDADGTDADGTDADGDATRTAATRTAATPTAPTVTPRTQRTADGTDA